ncbi:MAG TPA: hypothetical protein VK013_10740 [Myxococcaceae bacterium]|nr:hypothetical protein [Myxococcaceae bacterium]
MSRDPEMPQIQPLPEAGGPIAPPSIRESLAEVLARSHAAVRRCERASRAASAMGDTEVSAFFRHAESVLRELADHGEALLAERLGAELIARRRERERRARPGPPKSSDLVDQASWESFPASDPPAY